MTRATIATELGDIDVELFDESAPKAAGNFIDLARKAHSLARKVPENGSIAAGRWERWSGR